MVSDDISPEKVPLDRGSVHRCCGVGVGCNYTEREREREGALIANHQSAASVFCLTDSEAAAAAIEEPLLFKLLPRE